MNIRSFEERDFPAIVTIYGRSKLDELIYEGKKFELLPLVDDQKRLAELRESDIYVYDDNGVIGYGALYGSEIRSLFVHPDGRGKGIGRKLLEYLLSQVKETISIYVAKSNMPAKTLYENFGFSVVEEFETSYNGVSVLAYKMVRVESNGL